MANVLQQLKVILGIETKGFPSARQAVRGMTEGVQRDLSMLKNTVAGYFTIAAGTELARSVSHMAQRWKDVSEQTGMSLEKTQRYDAFLKSVGGSVEDLIGAFDILIDKRKEALEKGGDAAQLFRSFGISEQELRNLRSGEQIFARIAAVANDPTNIEQRNQFVDMFGAKRAGKLLAGAAAMNEGREVSIMSDEQIKLLDEAAKSFERGALEFKIAAAPLVVALTSFASRVMRNLFGDGGTPEEQRRSETQDLIEQARPLRGLFGMRTFGGSPLGKKEHAEAKALFDELAGSRGVGETLSQERLDAIRQRLAELSQGRSTPLKPIRPASSQPAGVTGTTPANVNPIDAFKADTDAARKRYQDALDGVFFKSANPMQKRSMLQAEMERDMRDASAMRGKGDEKGASELEAGVIKKAGELAAMDHGGKFDVKPDQLASVGGFIGGAAVVDASLTVQQNQLTVLQNILLGINNLPPNMREAIQSAIRGGPINRLQ